MAITGLRANRVTPVRETTLRQHPRWGLPELTQGQEYLVMRAHKVNRSLPMVIPVIPFQSETQ